MNSRQLYLLGLLLPALSVAAEENVSNVLERTSVSMQGMRHIFAQSYDNPAVKQWMLPVSYSELEISYEHDKQSQATNPQLGDGSNVAAFDADAYIKHGSSTLWGKAYYHNGKQYDLQSNETSDAALIYPYFTTDEIGGDMNLERYYFAGGFADSNERWAWGGTLSYLAGLYYRNVDPRPRNVTGTLDASLGAAYRVTKDYFAGVSLNFRKYKQSNDIEFVSEMGSSIIYHATGLGTHYSRFAGTGDAAYYNGYRYGATANLYPASGNGFIASLGVSRFTFDKVLTDLNRLPLCSVWHNALTLQAGYAHSTDNHTTAIAFNYDVYRRHGRENIFGDAATSIYPQIGYLEMYADNHYTLSLSGLYEYHDNEQRLISVAPKVGYSHDRQVYVDPRRDMLLNDVNASVAVKGAISPARHWLLSAEVGYELTAPLSSSALIISDPAESERSLISATEQTFLFASHNQSDISANVSVTRSISQRYALQLAIDYTRSQYTDKVHGDYLKTSIKFIF
jgi:hypothetical protein